MPHTRPAGPRVCEWCAGPIPATARVDAEVCGVVCRKRRWRFRRAVPSGSRASRDASRGDRRGTRPAHQVGPAGHFAYADPPYPGKADYYVERQEVDHADLIDRLEAGYPDGWALSTSAAALRDVLPLCPLGARVAVWRRRVRVTASRRPLSAWEPLIVVRGRELKLNDHVLDELETADVELDVLDYRGRYDAFPGALVGMKPPEFAVWLFRQLGAMPGDEVADIFPGSGAVTLAWELYASRNAGDVERDASQNAGAGERDASRSAAVKGNASLVATADASRPPGRARAAPPPNAAAAVPPAGLASASSAELVG